MKELECVGPSHIEMEGSAACSVSPKILPCQINEGRNSGSPIKRTDSPSKKKGSGCVLTINSSKVFCDITFHCYSSFLQLKFDSVPSRKEEPAPRS